jgi:hypothetical protein
MLQRHSTPAAPMPSCPCAGLSHLRVDRRPARWMLEAPAQVEGRASPLPSCCPGPRSLAMPSLRAQRPRPRRPPLARALPRAEPRAPDGPSDGNSRLTGLPSRPRQVRRLSLSAETAAGRAAGAGSRTDRSGARRSRAVSASRFRPRSRSVPLRAWECPRKGDEPALGVGRGVGPAAVPPVGSQRKSHDCAM